MYAIKNFIRTKLFGLRSCNPVYQQLLSDVRPLLFDIGAAEGLQPQWSKLLGSSDFFLFEPDPRSRKDLTQWTLSTGFEKDFKIFSDALSDKVGKEKLLLTNVRTGSTLMKIDEASEGYKHLSKSYFFPANEEEISVTNLNSFCQQHQVRPDGIKIDTQGAEFKVLQGASDILSDVLLLDFEVGLVPLYKDQASFQTIFDDLNRKGFSLFDVRVSRAFLCKDGSPEYYLKYFPQSIDFQALSARPWEFDCVFLRKPELILEEGSYSKLMKLIGFYCVYNFYAEAVALTEAALEKKILDAAKAGTIKAQIMELYEINRNQNRWSFFAQRVKEMRGIQRRQYWGRFVWMEYPNS